MTAEVIDMAEYRLRKVDTTKLFEGWTSDRLEKHFRVLKHIENGNTDVIDMRYSMVRVLFPTGFDPEANPHDNIALVRREGERRGVSATWE